MPSSIDATKPANTAAFTADMRANFAAAKSEIEDFGSVADGSGDALVAVKLNATGSVARTQHEKNAETVSGADFVGYDPTGATDSQPALTNAVARLAAGSTLIIQGTPLLASQLVINKKLRLVFEGGYGTTASDLPASYFIKKSTMTTAAVSIANASGIKWEGGGVVGQPGNTGDGIVVLGNTVTLDGVTVTGAGNDGIRVGSDAGGTNQNGCQLLNPRCYGNGRRGIYIHDGGTHDANVFAIISPFCQLNGEDGIRIGTANDGAIFLPISESNTGQGIHFAGGDRNSLDGGDVEANTAGQVLIDVAATNTELRNFNFVAYTVVDNGTTTRRLDTYPFIYRTFTDPSNFERIELIYSGTTALLRTNQAGTGTARPFQWGTEGAASALVRTNGVARWLWDSNGHYTANADNSYDIGASGNFRPRNLYLGSSIKQIGGITTSGVVGAPAIVATGRVITQGSANASISTFTVGASDASFEVSANVLVTASTTHNFTVTCAYTDESNTARTLTLNFTNVGGTIATAIANAGGAVPYMGIPVHIRCKAATTITLATTGTFTTVTYNVEGVIRQLA